MKLLAAFLVFMIAAQPVQAGFCDMDPSGSSSPDPAQQHHPEETSDDHGCCDPADGDERSPCSDRMHCGSCATSVAAIAVEAALDAAPAWPTPVLLSSGVLAPSHASPPYRPPIVIS